MWKGEVPELVVGDGVCDAARDGGGSGALPLEGGPNILLVPGVVCVDEAFGSKWMARRGDCGGVPFGVVFCG